MFCEQCGAQMPDNMKFCPACGAKVDGGDMTGAMDAGQVQQQGGYGNPQQQGYGQMPQGQPPVQPGPAPGPQGFNQGQPYPGQGPYPQMRPGQMGPGQMSAKKKGSPALIIILVVLVLIIGGVVAGIFVLKNKVKGKMDELGITGIIDDTQDMINGMTGNYDSRIKIPEGATPVMDANLMNLVGEYEGEFQCTTLEGMENIPNAPADQVKAKVEEALSTPAKCTLEIEDDGDWDFKIELLGTMYIGSHDFKVDDPQNAAEASAHLIQLVNGGIYDIEVQQTDEIDSKDLGSGTATGKFIHTGAYCEKDGNNLIAGFLSESMNLNGADIKFEGNFTVNKTTGDYVPEGGEEAMDETNGKNGSGNDDDYGQNGSYEDNREDTDDRDDNEDNDRAKEDNENDRDTGSSGSTGISGDPSQTAVKGGEWDQMQSGEFQYIDKSGKVLTCAWAEDEGGYYYLGPDGCLVYNNYSHDGYWADRNGCWDPSKPKVDTQVDILNNTYVGSLWTLDVYMNDSRSGTAKWWYTNTFGGGEPKKYDFTIKQLGPSSYAAYSDINDNEIYLISVVDDGWSIILSCDGSTDTLKIQ